VELNDKDGHVKLTCVGPNLMDNEHICGSFKESRVDNYDVMMMEFFFFCYLIRQLSILSDLVLET
jgi:hypothetical protein